MASKDSGIAQNIAGVLQPLLKEVEKNVRENFTVQLQEVLLKLDEIQIKLDLVEKAAGGAKKAPKTDKKSATKSGDDETAPVLKSTFPVNKLLFFRDRFKADVKFREKYFTDDLVELAAKDEKVSGKTKPDQILIAKANFCWDYIKKNKQDVLSRIEAEYDEAKKASEAKPKQQDIEDETP